MKESNSPLVVYIKGIFFKLVRTQAVKAIISAGLKMSGPVGIIANIVIGKLSKIAWEILYKLGVKYKNQVDEKIQTAKELKEYKEKISNENSTPEDIKNAGRDFLTK